MGRLLRGIGAFALCLWILNCFERYQIPINTSGTLVLVILVTYTIVFPGGKRAAVGTTTKTITQERIINLHDDSLGDIFIPSQYPTYRKERSGADGNDYMSPSGGIICTKYVTSTENVQTVYKSSKGKHILCVVCILLTTAYWNQYIPVNSTLQRLLPMKRNVDFDYTGYYIDEVERELKMHGWYVNINRDYDGTEQIGTVLGQEIDEENNQVTLYVSDGLALDRTVNSSDAYIEANVTTLSLRIGEVVHLTYYCSGDLPDTYYLNGTIIPDVKGTWGWFDNNAITLDIEGISESKGYIRVFLYDSSNDEVLAYTDVFINVQ